MNRFIGYLRDNRMNAVTTNKFASKLNGQSKIFHLMFQDPELVALLDQLGDDAD